MTPQVQRSISVTLLAAVFMAGCQTRDNIFEKRRAAERQRETAIMDAEDEASIKYNAVRDWARIPAQSTANVKAALIRADQRPLFFTGRLRDIDLNDRAYLVTVDVDAWLPEVLRFRLKCEPDQAGPLLEVPIGTAIVGVAAILDVRMTRDGALPGFGRQFTATGLCLTIKPMA